MSAPSRLVRFETIHTPAQKEDHFPTGKRKFFRDLHERIVEQTPHRILIQDTPGFRFRLMQCEVCKELYWLTDVYNDLDYCLKCLQIIDLSRLKNANAS